MTRFVALLRGVNVGGHRKVPMAELRDVCATLGFANVQTYVQSGNVVFDADLPGSSVERRLEAAIEQQFGFRVEVIARTAAQWGGYVAGNPSRDVADVEPKRLHLALSKRAPHGDAVEALRARATLGERIEICDDALCIDFVAGVGKSKLTPTLLDRIVGSPVTVRNWNTVLALRDLLGASE